MHSATHHILLDQHITQESGCLARAFHFSRGGREGTFVCPLVFFPQQCALPSDVTPHEWPPPQQLALTI